MMAGGQNLFSDEEDDFWSNREVLPADIHTEADKDASLFQSTQSSSSLPISSISLSPTLSGSSAIFSEHSFRSNVTEDMFDVLNDAIKCEYTEPLVDFVKEKDSGYDATPTVKSETLNEFVPYEDQSSFDIENYEIGLTSYDHKTEVEKFLSDPDSSELFCPNLDYYEAKLKEAKVLPDLKSFIRQNLEKVLNTPKPDDSIIQKIHASPPPTKEDEPDTQNSVISELVETQRSVSPDIFENEGNDSDMGEIKIALPKLTDSIKSTLKETNDELALLTQCLVSQIPLDKDELTQRPGSRRIAKLLEDIQKIMESFLEKTMNDEQIELEIRNSSISSNCFLDSDDVLTLRPASECIVKRVAKNNEKSRFRFEIIMFLLSEIHHFLLTGISCTARELYYKDPEFVRDPVNIHLGMKDVCNLLSAAPWELGVFSSSKGLIAGSLVMLLANGEQVNCSLHSGGILLPHDTTGIKSLQSTAKYALLVEKDTVYEKLLKQNIFEILGPDIILITGKGFPDINTRVIVKKIASELNIPIFGLFDADPFGIEIFFVYRHGSRAMSFNADKLACPQVKWIGVHPSEIELLGIPSLALSTGDKKKLKHLLERPYINDTVKSELEVMQRGNRKAEIEGISSFSENYLLAEYIPNKIKRNFVL